MIPFDFISTLRPTSLTPKSSSSPSSYGHTQAKYSNTNKNTIFYNKTKLIIMNTQSESQYDRATELIQFDDSKQGVKGLVDSGLTTIPRFFIHPPETLSDIKRKPECESRRESTDVIPTIDLSAAFDTGGELRSEIVEKIARASRELGFFQIVNHGIEVDILDRLIGAIRGFHEQPTEIKAKVYRRGMGTGVSFFSNVDLFFSKAASWRDTLQVRLGPTLPELDEIPEICRNEIVEWNQHMTKLGELLMGLLCEGLGVETERLKKLTFLEGKAMVAHYYPYCPQPDLTVGISSHTDPGALTILLQDHIGGLQVKSGGDWVDVKPVPGALVINIGDILQIMSNDEYKSVEHRVLANPNHEPRVSIAVFFNPSDRDGSYGPFPELISPEKPALFKKFTYSDYIKRFFTKELDGKSLVNYYRLSDTD